MDIEKLIEHLERRGLSNGSSLGPHSGLYDEAADALTALLAENEKLQKLYQEEKAVCHATQAELERMKQEWDAAVRHGRWEFLGPNRLNRDCMCGTCSVCHVRSKYIVNTAICPNCGAPMDKEDEHD